MNEQIHTLIELVKTLTEKLDKLDTLNLGLVVPPITVKYLDLKQAAIQLGCSVSGLRYKIKNNQIKAITNGKKLMIKASDIDKYFKNQNPLIK